MAFKALSNAVGTASYSYKNPSLQLYRSITKEVPRVIAIYDADVAPTKARQAIQELFRANKDVSDPMIKDMLIKKGYMELEETLLQWKQKTHLLRLLDAPEEVPRKYRTKKTFMDQFLTKKLDI